MKIRSGFVSNSSSSSFVVNKTVTIDPSQVKELLTKLLTFYTEWTGERLSFEEVFDDPFVATKEYVDEFNRDRQGCDHINNPGNVIINSASDNSIPYELYDLIQNKFQAQLTSGRY